MSVFEAFTAPVVVIVAESFFVLVGLLLNIVAENPGVVVALAFPTEWLNVTVLEKNSDGCELPSVWFDKVTRDELITYFGVVA